MRKTVRHRLTPSTAAFLLAAAGLSGAVRADTASTIHVAACGLEFDLPADYKITRPKRSTQDGDGGRQCSFDIVKARPDPPQRGECKDKSEGGQPPYNVCDWMLSTGSPSTPSVRVVRGQPESLSTIDPFFRSGEIKDGGHWMLPNAQAGDQPAAPFDFHGKSAWRGETAMRMDWWRQRVKNYTGIYAGSSEVSVTLVQFAPDLLVQLQSDEEEWCAVFCPSLRLGARSQDLP